MDIKIQMCNIQFNFDIFDCIVQNEALHINPPRVSSIYIHIFLYG